MGFVDRIISAEYCFSQFLREARMASMMTQGSSLSCFSREIWIMGLTPGSEGSKREQMIS